VKRKVRALPAYVIVEPEYQTAKKLRDGAADLRMVAVQGI
jgi:uncharacterized protein (DUF1330 family)